MGTSLMESREGRRLACTILVLAAGLCLMLAGASTARAGAQAGDPALRAQLQSITAAGAPGAIVLVRDRNSTTRLVTGYADLKTKTPVRATHRFRVGSATKTFVATVVLQLAAEGRLALDDSVEQWLPGLVPNGRAITVKHLLGMTSGLFDYLNDGDKTIERTLLAGDWTHRWAPRQLIGIATKHPPRFAPGEGWSYCNTCYVLLGMIVERVTGHTIGSELGRRILTPLRLRATSFDAQPTMKGRWAHGYELVGKPPLLDVSVLSPSAAWAAGALVSTADDLARFYGALLGGRLLARDSVASMTSARKVNKEFGYGLGLARLELPCGPAWGHDGGIPGYRTWALSSRDGRRQAVVLANLGEDSLTPAGAAAVMRTLVTAYCG